eukprot:31499-Pelagococcus_subviridis.AAC.1
MSAATAAGSKGFSAQPGSATGATTPFATVNVSPFLWCATRATLPSLRREILFLFATWRLLPREPRLATTGRRGRRRERDGRAFRV